MSFEESYKKYNNIIHYLLKSYQITYNYDEFYQQMLIKMWQLTLDFDEQQSSSFKSYLFIRLKFYLIDLFRQKDTTLNIVVLIPFQNFLRQFQSTKSIYLLKIFHNSYFHANEIG